MCKLNLGCSPGWSKPGWTTLDHKHGFRTFQAWCMPFDDKVFDTVFCSHMFEHISHFKIEQVICEINRVMMVGGVLRILTPDLRKLVYAYVDNDTSKMDLYISEDGSGISRQLGLGQALMGFIVSPGFDNLMFDSDLSGFIGGYGHMFCFDFEMLCGLLTRYGFDLVQEKDIDDSRILDHKELRLGCYDMDKKHSLIVECVKKHDAAYDRQGCVLFNNTRHLYWMNRGIMVKPFTRVMIKICSLVDKCIFYLPLLVRRYIQRLMGWDR